MPVIKLLIEKAGGIATITLNRPEQGNAIDMDLARELARAAPDRARDHRPTPCRCGRSDENPFRAEQ